jgi:hypothetical protein
MNDMNRRNVMKLAATAGVVALAGPAAQAADPPAKKAKHNTEPPIESTAAPESHGPRELFAVVDSDGKLRRGMHVASSVRLDIGAYEVVFNRDVRRGVYLVTPGGHGYTGTPIAAVASVIGRATNPRGVLVNMANLQGDPVACGFHLLVVCPDGFA